MYYVPVTTTNTTSCYRSPTGYIPVYTTSCESSNSYVLNNDLSRVKKELAEIREELSDLRFEKQTCRLCSSASASASSKRTKSCDETCSICYPRKYEREENYYRSSSPIHYCSICHDYVIDQEYPPPPPVSPCSSRKYSVQIDYTEKEDKLSEYLSRQLDLQRLRQRYIPQQRPVWIPTAYKHDYPNRRWATRHAHFSEP